MSLSKLTVSRVTTTDVRNLVRAIRGLCIENVDSYNSVVHFENDVLFVADDVRNESFLSYGGIVAYIVEQNGRFQILDSSCKALFSFGAWSDVEISMRDRV